MAGARAGAHLAKCQRRQAERQRQAAERELLRQQAASDAVNGVAPQQSVEGAAAQGGQAGDGHRAALLAGVERSVVRATRVRGRGRGRGRGGAAAAVPQARGRGGAATLQQVLQAASVKEARELVDHIIELSHATTNDDWEQHSAAFHNTDVTERPRRVGLEGELAAQEARKLNAANAAHTRRVVTYIHEKDYPLVTSTRRNALRDIKRALIASGDVARRLRRSRLTARKLRSSKVMDQVKRLWEHNMPPDTASDTNCWFQGDKPMPREGLSPAEEKAIIEKFDREVHRAVPVYCGWCAEMSVQGQLTPEEVAAEALVHADVPIKGNTGIRMVSVNDVRLVPAEPYKHGQAPRPNRAASRRDRQDPAATATTNEEEIVADYGDDQGHEVAEAEAEATEEEEQEEENEDEEEQEGQQVAEAPAEATEEEEEDGVRVNEDGQPTHLDAAPVPQPAERANEDSYERHQTKGYIKRLVVRCDDGEERFPVCSACFKKIAANNASDVHQTGMDFGVLLPELERLSVVERAFVALVHPYSQLIMLTTKIGGAHGYSSRGHTITFPQNSFDTLTLVRKMQDELGELRARNAVEGLTVDEYRRLVYDKILSRKIDEQLMVHFVGPHGLATTVGGELTRGWLRADRRNILDAYRALIKQHPLYVNLPDPYDPDEADADARLAELEARLPDVAAQVRRVLDSALLTDADARDVTSVQESMDRLAAGASVSAGDEEDAPPGAPAGGRDATDVLFRRVLAAVNDVTREDDAAVQGARVDAGAGVSQDSQQQQRPQANVNSEEMETQQVPILPVGAVSMDVGDLPQDTAVGRAAAADSMRLAWARATVAQGEDPLNEFTENDRIFTAAFPHLFPLGFFPSKSLPRERDLRHMMCYYDGRFSKDPLFVSMLNNQRVRHLTCRATAHTPAERKDQLLKVISDPNFLERATIAAEKASGANPEKMTNDERNAHRFMRQSLFVITNKVAFSDGERAKGLLLMQSLIRCIAQPSFFITATPSAIDTALGVRLCLNVTDARLGELFSGELARFDLEDVKDMGYDERARYVFAHPAATAIFFKHFEEKVIEILLGAQVRRSSTPKKDGENEPGVFGKVRQ